MKEIQILLVEDNEGDIVLTLEAFSEANLKNTVHVVRDGEQAVQFLNNAGHLNCPGIPDIILLDINLPRMDGKEVLNYVKNHPQFKFIPVVMLTTSASEKDILDAYGSHANCYILKPVDYNKFITVIQSIENFWMSIVQLPKTNPHAA